MATLSHKEQMVHSTLHGGNMITANEARLHSSKYIPPVPDTKEVEKAINEATSRGKFSAYVPYLSPELISYLELKGFTIREEGFASHEYYVIMW